MVPGPPTIGEILLGPWRGLSIYPRAALVRPWQAIGLLLLLTLAGSCLATGRWYLVRSSKLADLAESQVWLMPRVTVEDGTARFEGGEARLLDARHFLVWIDTSTDSVRGLQLRAGEERAVLHVGQHVLTVHRPGRPPHQIPWGRVTGRGQRLSLDGPEAIEWGRRYLRTIASMGLGTGFVLAAGWQILLVLVLSWLYRVIAYRGLYVPGLATLVTVGAVASGPALVLATLGLVVGLGQGMALTVHGLVLGLLFLLGATRVRLGDEQPDRPRPASAEVTGSEAGAVALPGAADAPAARNGLPPSRDPSLQ